MKIETHHIKQKKIAEIISNQIILKTLDDGLTLLGDLYYQGYDYIVLYENNISLEFFDLKTRLAGDILQKFTQYQLPLIIIGNFAKYTSSSLHDFIFESNKGKQINFLSSIDEVLTRIAQRY